MTKKAKLSIKFSRNPAALTYLQIEKLLLNVGCEKVQAKGSHVKFKYPGHKPDLIIPVHNNDCKPFYKTIAYQFIKDLLK